MSARLIFRSSDFDRPIEISRRSLIFACVCAVILLAVYGCCAAYIGSWWAIETAKDEARKLLSVRRIEPATTPPQFLDCSSNGRTEYLRTCLGRKRAEITK